MNIKLRGKPDSVSGSELRYATKYMSSLIMSPQLTKKLDVTLSIIGNKRESDEQGKFILEGQCEWLDNNHFPRKFKVKLNGKMGRRKLLLALAHELVHVKQYAQNELKDTFRGPTNVKWKKEWFDDEAHHYYDLPWEIEAHGRELGMYERYVKHVQNMNLKF